MGKRIVKLAGWLLGIVVILAVIAFEFLDLLLPAAPVSAPVTAAPDEPMARSELIWMGGIMLATVVSLLLVRRWVYRRPISFEHDGRLYTHHHDGHFTDSLGARIVDPIQVAALTEAAEAWRQRRSRANDNVNDPY